MVIISDTSEIQSVYFPKTKEGNPTAIRLYSELTHYTERFGVEDISNNKLYYQFSLDFSDIPMGEYEYTIFNVLNQVLEEGLIRLGEVKDRSVIYSLTETYTIYNPETGEGEIIYDNSCEEVAAQAFSDGYVSGTTDGYSSGYTDGYGSGYESGNTDGFNSGYTNGYTDGYSSGWTDGYTSGSTPTPTPPTSGFESMYFTIQPLYDGNISWDAPNLSYRIDNGSWMPMSGTVAVERGQELQIKGTNTCYSGYTITTNFGFDVYGNIMSLVYGDNFENQTTLTEDSEFSHLFQNKLVRNAENLILPATTLAANCYGNMFSGCRALLTPPALPATTLTRYCYQSMFIDCTSLTEAPALSATTLANYCYQYMFGDCTSLVKAPALPATTLTPYCYQYMFDTCTSLTEAPALPATTLAERCYQSMFNNCTALTEAPELPATTLANYCYINMFFRCTSLTTAPELPATTLATSCYSNMFYGCTSLTQAPELPATTLANYCYSNMFFRCTSLTTAPELSATTLAPYCYSNMFYGCTSLTQAPELPATTLAQSCYSSMFRNCTNLNYIKCLATDISATYCTRDWTDGVASAGTFVKAEEMSGWTVDSPNGIPVGWTVENDNPTDYSKKRFSVEMLEDGDINWEGRGSEYYDIIRDGVRDEGYQLYHSVDNLKAGDIVEFYLRADNTNPLNNSPITSTAKHNVYGNIMSLLYVDFEDVVKIPSAYQFWRLFEQDKGLVSAADLILPEILSENCFESMFFGCSSLVAAPELPAPILTKGCYAYMFGNCTSLVDAPELPSLVLAFGCYSLMFQGCTALVTAPELPATTLANACYYGMFWECSSLVNAPELPSVSVVKECYSGMFYGCTSLTTAPVLPAYNMVKECYAGMFKYCSSLNYIKCTASEDVGEDNSLLGWVEGVSPSGTFEKKDVFGWNVGVDGVPEGWSIININN